MERVIFPSASERFNHVLMLYPTARLTVTQESPVQRVVMDNWPLADFSGFDALVRHVDKLFRRGSRCHVFRWTIFKGGRIAAGPINFPDSGNIHEQVLEFCRKFDVPVLDRPKVPDAKRVRMCAAHVLSEALELVAATIDDTWRPREDLKNLDELRGLLLWLVEDAPLKVDFPGIVDALADLDYVSEGTRIEFGVDGAPVAAGVHAANMAKEPVPGGDVKKPEGWKAFDVAAELGRQGWEDFFKAGREP